MIYYYTLGDGDKVTLAETNASAEDLPVGAVEITQSTYESLTADPEQVFHLYLVADVITYVPPTDPPRRMPRFTFLTELNGGGLYDDLQTWLASQPVATQIYFGHADSLAETDAEVIAALTALSLDPEAFYDAVLT